MHLSRMRLKVYFLRVQMRTVLVHDSAGPAAFKRVFGWRYTVATLAKVSQNPIPETGPRSQGSGTRSATYLQQSIFSPS